MRAVFIRDPDYTTFEFENNVGEDDELPSGFTESMIGNNRRLDHVGIRVREPQARLQWYAEKLGFVREVRSATALRVAGFDIHRRATQTLPRTAPSRHLRYLCPPLAERPKHP